MKTKILILLIAIATLQSCGESEGDKFDRFMSELECPVILISKTDKAVQSPSITVRDAKGRVRTFSYIVSNSSMGFPQSVSQSREIGDTLKPCNPKIK